MGFAHLMYFYDDGLSQAEKSEERWEELTPKVGAAVLKLCLDPDEALIPPAKTERVTSVRIGHHGNTANFCDKVHASEQETYAWIGNRLAKLEDLEDDEFQEVLGQVMDEKARRDL